MNILIKMTDSKEIEKLRKRFEKIDKDRSGMISIIELKEALFKSKLQHNDEELNQILKELADPSTKNINYSDFLAATISVQKILTEEKLQAIFRQFDTDGNG